VCSVEYALVRAVDGYLPNKLKDMLLWPHGRAAIRGIFLRSTPAKPVDRRFKEIGRLKPVSVIWGTGRTVWTHDKVNRFLDHVDRGILGKS
jgi:hypothetical protein